MTNQPKYENIEDERAIRLQKLSLLEEQGIAPYKIVSKRTHYIEGALKEAIDTKVAIAGRMVSKRVVGKIIFAVVQDVSASMQVIFKSDDLGTDNFKLFVKMIDLGDFIEVSGARFKTERGEESILVKEWQLLSKSIRPMPDKFHGLKDKETRFRKRYLDLITDREVFERFKMRSKIVSYVREFLNERDFLEVETPVLQTLYGGTNARPFTTHINAYDMDMYLRVAPELYLKRLVVGGYEKVYEIGKNFRNEGADQTHNPEFTMIEWYEAYVDYQTVMDNAEAMYKFIAKKLFDKEELPTDNGWLDISKAWPRITMIEALEKYAKIKVAKFDEKELKKLCVEYEIENRGSASRGQMIMDLFEKLVTEKLISPTWIIDYPKEVSPLSRTHRDNPDLVERFECYVNGKEIGDGWSEIIDPRVQRARFENEQASMRAGNEESHPMDEDFLEALEYALPPLGGIGIGIDRLVMLYTNQSSIREVMFFPIMREE